MNNKLHSYTATLPDGALVFRTSTHAYTHIVAIQLDKAGWFAEWRTGEKAAKARAAAWLRCPFAKAGGQVETKVIALEK